MGNVDEKELNLRASICYFYIYQIVDYSNWPYHMSQEWVKIIGFMMFVATFKISPVQSTIYQF